MEYTDEQKEQMYLDYFNNFLTTDVFAEYYQISAKDAERIIGIGRLINHTKYK
jgi:hypothetical protein